MRCSLMERAISVFVCLVNVGAKVEKQLFNGWRSQHSRALAIGEIV